MWVYPSLLKMAKFAFLVSVAFLAVFPLASNANTSSSTASVADLGEADVTAREHSDQNGRWNPRTPVIRKEYGMIFLLGAILSGVLGIIGASRRSAALQVRLRAQLCTTDPLVSRCCAYLKQKLAITRINSG